MNRKKSAVLLLNKPFRVMSQFSPAGEKDTLKSYVLEQNFYPAGRLDYDSEGLLLLTDNGKLQHYLTDPKHKLPKTYWVQVEGDVSEEAINQLRQGVTLKDGITRPAQVTKMDNAPNLWARNPPIRYRAAIPESWLSITLTEGRNRQVRRMTAAVGYPTLRLVRWSIGPWSLGDLLPGETTFASIPAELKFTQARNPKPYSQRPKAR